VIPDPPHFDLRLAVSARDRLAAQRLRYRVFVQELGGDGPLVDHDRQLERDAFDPLCDHLLLIDRRCDPATLDDVIGTYRLLPSARLGPGDRFCSEQEYDLSPLNASGRRLLELGRSCVHPDHRGGSAMLTLWNGLAGYVIRNRIDLLFGVASFHGTDPQTIAEPLSWLHHHHMAPPDLRVRATGPHRAAMDRVPPDRIDRKRAMLAMPPLIKAYLRLGGCVGDGACIDPAFNTVDVCLMMDTARMSAAHRAFYTKATL
jgi:L-ornithine Nalpha-acyltransferase